MGLDSRLSLPLTGNLVRTASDVPLLVFCAPQHDQTRVQALTDAGAGVFETEPDGSGLPSVTRVLEALAASGITRLLVEGGALVAAALIRANLVDRISLYRSGRVIGGDGLPAIGGFGLEVLSDAPAFTHTGSRILGDDVLETYRRAD